MRRPPPALAATIIGAAAFASAFRRRQLRWGAADAPAPYDFTWAFVLRPQSDGTTRLLVRERYAYLRWWAPLIVEPVAVASFVMTERMLRGIRDRAETGPPPEDTIDVEVAEPIEERGRKWTT